MKQYRSKLLKFISAVSLASPIAYVTLTAILFDIPLSKCISILLSPSYFVASVATLVAGYGLWEMQRWSWPVFLVAQFFISYENINLVINFSESHHKISAFVVATVFQICMIYVVAKEIQVPYLYPRIRWWESNPRYRLSTPVVMKCVHGQQAKDVVFEGEVLDISVSGCFIKTRSDFNQDDVLSLSFEIFSYSIECEGNVVWIAQSSVTHPKGIGVKFGPLPKNQKRLLRNVQRKLKKIAALFRSARYWLSQEEFIKQLEAIEKGRLESSFRVYRRKK